MVGFLSAVGTLGLYRPIIRNDGWEALVANRFVTPDPIPFFFRATPRFLGEVASMWTHNVPVVMVVLLVVGLLASLLGDPSRAVRLLGRGSLGAVAALYLIQHVIPYPRNWLVLLPIALGLAASGTVSLVDRLRPSSTAPSWAALASVGVAAWMVMSVVGSTTSLSGEDDGLADAEIITLELASTLQASDHVVAAIPSTAPLRYYFELHDLPLDALGAPTGDVPELFVVTAGEQTPAEVLESSEISGQVDLTLVSKHPTGSLWRAVRASDAPVQEGVGQS